uniref:Uncharacterized protein n=1 Tax=Mycobacterium riyadhense TaxID=486698 RepID=A0A653F5E6_9MYCO|nr:hypothetical protein BIN_B_05713 [Mycobacterium riyadhense]
MSARVSSTGFDGARYRSASPYSGVGRARVSSLPLSVKGNSSSATTAAGTICCGSRSASAARMLLACTLPVT